MQITFTRNSSVKKRMIQVTKMSTMKTALSSLKCGMDFVEVQLFAHWSLRIGYFQ